MSLPEGHRCQERKCLADLASAFVLLCGGSGRRLTSLELGEGRGGVEGDKASPALPLWLMDAGVTFDFEDRNAEGLLFGEVSTDLFGRGIDIERVNIVINYDMPDESHWIRIPRIPWKF